MEKLKRGFYTAMGTPLDKDGNVDIYLRLIGDLGLDETVLIEGNTSTEEITENSNETPPTQTVPNTYNHT